ncbi:IS630 family transposase [Sphingomonas sp. Leaf5]|uniref:IS630 family transposase n=1 Tax=unclassified Sphingomonas TaxID=196159 RepID=UPI0039DFAFA9
MAKPYSMDLRERVVRAVTADGMSCHAAASRFGVAPSSAIKWVRRFRDTGSAAPSRMGGRRSKILSGATRDWLLERMTRDFTLRGLVAELGGRGVKVDYVQVWRFAHVEGLSFKKKRVLPAEQLRPAIARRRAQWKKYQGRLDPARLVFIDETWVKTNMAPLRGWAPVGQRLHAKVPYGHWRTMTFLAALRCDRIDAPCVLDQPVNAQSFTDYIEQCLVPTLSPGDVVIMDNLSSHKRPAIRNAIRTVGAKLLFLPPYSPDLNPIEQVFAKLKHLMRKAAERSHEATWRRVGTLLDAFSAAECRNYLVNAGYGSA